MKRLKTALPCAAAVALFFALAVFSRGAADGVRRALALCAEVIIPTLFPFFAASSLLTASGVPRRLERALSPVTTRLFGVSGAGAAAFVAGICGGYPIGAATVAELVRCGEVSPAEGSRLLPFCNNSGPAFIIGAAGAGVFGSPACGALLYACHVLAAVTVGALLSGAGGSTSRLRAAPGSPSVTSGSVISAVPEAVRFAVKTVLGVCGFVAAFMALVGALDEAGAFPALCGALAEESGLSLSFCRALLVGIIEIGGGVGAMNGLSPTALNLALCAFLIGWGGVSVHLQTAAVCSGTKISAARHTVGRLMCGAFSAAYVFLFCAVLRLPRI